VNKGVITPVAQQFFVGCAPTALNVGAGGVGTTWQGIHLPTPRPTRNQGSRRIIC
jgi:hypothetical protein